MSRHNFLTNQRLRKYWSCRSLGFSRTLKRANRASVGNALDFLCYDITIYAVIDYDKGPFVLPARYRKSKFLRKRQEKRKGDCAAKRTTFDALTKTAKTAEMTEAGFAAELSVYDIARAKMLETVVAVRKEAFSKKPEQRIGLQSPLDLNEKSNGTHFEKRIEKYHFTGCVQAVIVAGSFRSRNSGFLSETITART